MSDTLTRWQGRESRLSSTRKSEERPSWMAKTGTGYRVRAAWIARRTVVETCGELAMERCVKVGMKDGVMSQGCRNTVKAGRGLDF